jgi:lysophospholipase
MSPLDSARPGSADFQISDLARITLVDAGLTNQNIPVEPLLTPYRNVDAIIAFDSSADTTYSWPNGTALRQTFERAEILAQTQDVRIRMPRIPSANGFVNGGFNQRPTIFGCDAQNGSTPLIVYVPNYPWSSYANTSTVRFLCLWLFPLTWSVPTCLRKGRIDSCGS